MEASCFKLPVSAKESPKLIIDVKHPLQLVQISCKINRKSSVFDEEDDESAILDRGLRNGAKAW